MTLGGAQLTAAKIQERFGEWRFNSGYADRERKAWQALFAVIGSLDLALRVADDIIPWPQPDRPPDDYLRRWAVEVFFGDASPDPAMEKLMAGFWQQYKQNRHWSFIENQINAAKKITDEIETTGATKSSAAVSYLGANVNYGMREVAHVPQQKAQQIINTGNVRIISSRTQPAITAGDMKKAEKALNPPRKYNHKGLIKPVDAEFKVLDAPGGGE